MKTATYTIHDCLTQTTKYITCFRQIFNYHFEKTDIAVLIAARNFMKTIHFNKNITQL